MDFEKRQQKLKERIRSLPEIPAGFQKWQEQEVVNNHYLFYKRTGRKVEVWCSKCRKKEEYRLIEMESFEDQFKHKGEKPKHKEMGKCGLCGVTGQYLAVGRKNKVEDKQPCYLWQMIDDKNFVIRYFEIYKESSVYGEQYEQCEIARNFIRKGLKKVQKDYHKRDAYSGKSFWDDCNLYGMSNIQQEPGKIYPDSWNELKKSHLKYSGLEEYLNGTGRKAGDIGFNYTQYLGQYNRFPAMEMLVKMGMYDLVMLSSKEWFDEKAKKPEDILKIDKRKFKNLLQCSNRRKYLKMYQMEKRVGIFLSADEEQRLFELMGEYSLDRYEKIAPYISVTKFINHVTKYASKPDKGTQWSEYRVATRYCDYLDMCVQMDYDLTDTIKLFPKDLNAAHDKMVLEVNQREADECKRKANEKYENIAKRYDSLEKIYGFETGEYLIRPVRDAGEMIEEGRLQHHCVGGDTYLNKHNTGKSYILLMRRKDTPDTPYITIEIKGTEILQWYGKYDKKTDKETTDAFLKEYVQQLKRKKQRRTA